MANITRNDPFSVSAFDPFDEVFRGFFRPVRIENSAQPQMKIDVEEHDQNYTVHAEIPGVDKENIHVTIDGNQVSISAEVRKENEVKEGVRVLRSERYFGSVSRSFTLENEIDESKAEAQYKDGVLELTLPKKTVSAAKRLTIK
ncbi:MAG: Hsp20/alpha crystallin family protein [Methylophilaceae bacterium]|jgi:HSP20 family protein|nr:Hsp20/alpha crystallin family protein [Methylophilaceae bacterium]